MSVGKYGDQPEAEKAEEGTTGTHKPMANPVAKDDAPEVVAEFEEKWLGGARPKTD